MSKKLDINDEQVDFSFLPDQIESQPQGKGLDFSFLPDQQEDFSFLPDQAETNAQKITRLQKENQLNKPADEYTKRGYGELSTPDFDKDKSIYYPGELRETFNQAFKTGFSGKKIENDVLARENPRMTFVGGVLGGLMPYLIPGGGMVKMAAIPFIHEGVRQVTTPEEKLSTTQRAGKLITAGTFGAVTGKLFDIAALKPVAIKNIFDTAAKVSALSIPESMIQDKISGKAIDIKNTLYNAGSNFAIMALLGAADHISAGPYRKMVINEAYKLRKAESVVNPKTPFTYEQAKALLQKNMVPVETLDPMTQAAIRGIQQEGAKAELSAFAKEYGFDQKVVDGVFSGDRNTQLKSLETLLSKPQKGYTNPGEDQTFVSKAGQEYTKIKNQYELFKNNPEASILDIILNHKIVEKLVPETNMTDTAKPKEAVAQDAEYETWLKSTMGLSPTETAQTQEQKIVQEALRQAEIQQVIRNDAAFLGLDKIPGQLTDKISLSATPEKTAQPTVAPAAIPAQQPLFAPAVTPAVPEPVKQMGMPEEEVLKGTVRRRKVDDPSGWYNWKIDRIATDVPNAIGSGRYLANTEGKKDQFTITSEEYRRLKSEGVPTVSYDVLTKDYAEYIKTLGQSKGKKVHTPGEKSKQTEKKLPDKKPSFEGKQATIHTDAGTEVKVRYALVEADKLIASHDTELNVNPKFPASLQPRERGRAASVTQIAKIGSNLNPAFLGESPKASEGAPVIGRDFVVESGNARTIALQSAYQGKYKESAAKYKAWLEENALHFRISKEDVAKMKAPVLVRIRETEVDRRKFVEEANQSGIAAMSSTEEAKIDAGRLTPDLLNMIVPNDSGDLLTVANQNFVRAFMQTVIGPNDIGRYVTPDGTISQQGVQRIKTAIFAKAYGSEQAVQMLAEDTDSNVRNILNGMFMAAPRVASLNEAIAAGARHDLSISEDIGMAATKLSLIRQQGLSVSSYINQTDMFGEGLTPIAANFMALFEKYKQAPKKIGEIINAYVEIVDKMGDPRQVAFDMVNVPDREGILDLALKKVNPYEGKSNQPNLALDKGGNYSQNVKKKNRKQNPINYKPLFEIRYRQDGALYFPGQEISSPEDVAFAFRHLKNAAVEHFYVVGTAEGKVVSVECISIGNVNSSIVDAMEPINLLMASGAKEFYMVHNHPSGDITPSPEDTGLSVRFQKGYPELGISYAGHIIIDDTKFGFIEQSMNFRKIEHKLTEGKHKEFVMRKYLEWKQSIENMESRSQFNKPEDVIIAVAEIAKGTQTNLYGDSIVFYLDQRNRVIATEIMPEGQFTVKNIAQKAAASRSKNLIIVNAPSGMTTEDKTNLTGTFQTLGFELLDVIDIGEYNYTSLKAQGTDQLEREVRWKGMSELAVPSLVKKTVSGLSTEDLGKLIDSRYAAGATQKEIDILESEYGQRTYEHNYSNTGMVRDSNWDQSNKRAEEIINGSVSMVDAQERIANEFGIKLSIEQLEAMRRKSNNGIFDFSFTKEAIDQLIHNIRQDKESAKVFDNLGLENFDIDPEALKESMSIAGIAKEKFENMKVGLKHAINQIEQPQVYLYYHPSSRPVAEGIIDAKQKLLKNLSAIESWQHTAGDIDSPEMMKKIAAEVDRDKSGNMFAALQTALRKGTITAKDVDAYTKAYYYMHRYVYDAIRKEIIEGRTGIRIKYVGDYYNISYTLKSGARSQRMVTEGELKYLQGKYGDVKIWEQKQKYSFKKLNPQTGEYEKSNYYLDDYTEALDMQDQETKDLLNELLPYSPQAGNYFPHSREQGGWWVEAYDLNSEAKEKLFSARVPLKVHAEAIAKEMQAKFGATARVAVRENGSRDKFMPSMGKMVDMMYFLNQAGVKVNSEAGQKIINGYRQMSGLFSHLIHSTNIPGFKTDWKSLVDSMGMIARSAAKREYRAELEDLFDLTTQIPDDFRANIATRYLKIMSSIEHNNPLMDATINITYFAALANKASYITQNMSEVMWSLAKVPKLNNDARFFMPLEQEYKDLLLKGKQEGVIKPFFVEEAERSGVMRKMDILGRASEVWSSKKSFEIGLRIARDRGLHGDEAYREAYQFLFNVAKPFYNPANRMNLLLTTEMSGIRKYGFLFLTWSHNFFNQFAHVPMRNKFNILLFWVLVAGFGTLPIPYMKKLMEKLGVVHKVKNPKNYDVMDRFLLGGFLGMMGISSRFIVPSSLRGIMNIGDVTNAFDILASMAQRAKMSYKKYGLPGFAAEMPLGGLQQPLKAGLSLQKGYYAGAADKPFYKPKSAGEKAVTALGYTPFEVGERYANRSSNFFENWGKKKSRADLMESHGIGGFGKARSGGFGGSGTKKGFGK